MQHTPDSFRDVPAVVAIPVRDEVERIVDCLNALSAQEGGAPGVVLLVNNTKDGTMQAVAECAPSLACPVIAVEHVFEAGLANAGQARRLAMQRADALAPAGAPLLTTDADGRALPDWLAANLFHLRHGIDAVFGRAEIDPVEAARIPPALHQADAEECALAAVLDELASLIDPDADDPWPRHTDHSGASIGVSRAAFRRVGGIPGVALGEDRAFHQALRRIDARIRHAPEVRVVVSGRILGRAEGGMADTIRRRLVAPETMLDDALEPVQDRVRRLRLRHQVRRARRSGPAALRALAAEWGLEDIGGDSFGAIWEGFEAAMPMARVPVGDCLTETATAVALRDALRPAAFSPAGEGSSHTADRTRPADLLAAQSLPDHP